MAEKLAGAKIPFLALNQFIGGLERFLLKGLNKSSVAFKFLSPRTKETKESKRLGHIKKLHLETYSKKMDM